MFRRILHQFPRRRFHAPLGMAAAIPCYFKRDDKPKNTEAIVRSLYATVADAAQKIEKKPGWEEFLSEVEEHQLVPELLQDAALKLKDPGIV